MDLDDTGLKVLEYLNGRVSFAIGDNTAMIVQTLGMTEGDFTRACDTLCSRGLAYRTRITEEVHRLYITDEGIVVAEHQKRARERVPNPSWWKFW